MNDTGLRLMSMIRKEFIQILRDPRTLVIIILIPIMQLFLLGFSATTDVKNVQLAIWDQNRTGKSRALVDAFRAANYFTIAYDVGSQEDIQRLIETGQVRAALIIPPDYDRQLIGGEAHVSMILDGSDPAVGSTALSTARLIGQSYATQVQEEQSALYGRLAIINAPVEVHTQVWYNPDLLSTYYMIPGVIGMILYTITSILTATTIVRERERGTIEQLIVTPIRSWELVIGKILPYVILAFFDTLEIIILGHIFFGVPVRGNLGSGAGSLRFAVALRPWHWTVGFDDGSYPAGSHAHGLDIAAAKHISLGLLLSHRGHAAYPAVGLLHYSTCAITS